MTRYKLALPEELLLSVEKPERYIGNEINAVKKDRTKPAVRFAICFPDVYEIGMSHLGIQILYDMFNSWDDVWCERVYSPWIDMDQIMREHHIPLFALESQDPVIDFDFLGITLQYELCYTNILQILDLSGIPLHAVERQYKAFAVAGESRGHRIDGSEVTVKNEEEQESLRGGNFGVMPREGTIEAIGESPQTVRMSHSPLLRLGEGSPIVIGGGPCAYNPEPVAEFFDLFYIGEGETVYRELIDLYVKCKTEGVSRREFLRRASGIPGIYCPLFYDVSYNSDGTVRSFVPNIDGVGRRVRRQVVVDFDSAPYIRKPLVPFMQVTQDRVVLEVQRGCVRGCRFCQAGMVYRPARSKSLEKLKEQARCLLSESGQDEISLSSLSTSDYPYLKELTDYLIHNFGERGHVNISLPSLRIDALSLDVMKSVQDVKKSSLTFAPEGGTQRMRDVINKGLTEDDILRGASLAFQGGWNKVKLYFMLGQPTETDEDRIGIVRLAEKIVRTYHGEVSRGGSKGRCMVTISTSFFVPKPFTPFQWAEMFSPEDYLGYALTVNREVKNSPQRKSIRYNWHDAFVTVLEGLLARGDRRVSKVVEEAYKSGALFDAWTEHWDWGRWVRAMDKTGISLDFYTRRRRKDDELLPWDFIDVGVTKKYLLDEWRRSLIGETTPNCIKRCNSCGASKYHAGVCCNINDGNVSLRSGTDEVYHYCGEGQRGEGQDAVEEQRAVSFDEAGDRFTAASCSDIQEADQPDLCGGKHSDGPGSDRSGSMKVRIRYSKHGSMKYIGHLDMMRYFQRVCRKALIGVDYTNGMSPHMSMSYALPLSVGMTSDSEYVDVDLVLRMAGGEILSRLNACAAEGIHFTDVIEIETGKANRGMALVRRADYTLTFREGYEWADGWENKFKQWLQRDVIPVVKKTKKTEREINIRPLIYSFSLRPRSFKRTETISLSLPHARINAFAVNDVSKRFHITAGPEAISCDVASNVSPSIGRTDTLHAGKTSEVMPMDRRTDSPTGGPMDRRTDSPTGGPMDRRTDSPTGGPMDVPKQTEGDSLKDAQKVARATSAGDDSCSQVKISGISLGLSAGSVDNIRPELVMKAFAESIGEKFSQYTFLINRDELYAGSRDGSAQEFIPLIELGIKL